MRVKAFLPFLQGVPAPETQNYIVHILDGKWERQVYLFVLHMIIHYQNELKMMPNIVPYKNRHQKMAICCIVLL